MSCWVNQDVRPNGLSRSNIMSRRPSQRGRCQSVVDVGERGQTFDSLVIELLFHCVFNWMY